MSWSIWIRLWILVLATGWLAWVYACRPPTCTPTAEKCDGVDNDCDGFVDEDTVVAESVGGEAVPGQVHFVEPVGDNFLVGGLDEGDAWVTSFTSVGGRIAGSVGLTSQPVGGELRAAVSGNRAVVSRVDEGANTLHLALINVSGGLAQVLTPCISLDDIVEQYSTAQDPRAAIPTFDPVTGDVHLFVYVEGSIRVLRFAVPAGCTTGTTWASPIADTLVVEDSAGSLGLDYAVGFPTSGSTDAVLAYYKRNSALFKNTLRVATVPLQTLQVNESEAVEIIGSTEGTVNPELAFGPNGAAALVYTNVTADPGGGPSTRTATLHRFNSATLTCTDDSAASIDTCADVVTETTADAPSVAYRSNQTWVIGHVTPVEGWGVAIADAVNGRYYGQGVETNSDPAATHVAVNSLGTALVSKSDMQGASLVRPVTIEATCAGVLHAGGPENDSGESDIDTDGNTVVAGHFSGTAFFGEGNAETALTSPDESDVFVAKYSPTGVLLWAINDGGPGMDRSGGPAVDSAGNVFVVGDFEGTATFGEGNDATMLTSAGDRDAFVAKYDPDGDLLWVEQVEASSSATGRRIDVDPTGQVVITGAFSSGIAVFGDGANAVTLSATATDTFVAKYDTNGELLWATDSDGAETTYPYGIAVDSAGNTLVTGHFYDDVTFGEGVDAVTLFNDEAFGFPPVQSDTFLAKYDPTGDLLWAKKVGGSNSENGQGVTFQADGSAVIVGRFSQAATFGEGANVVELLSTEAQDLFVAKYAPDGTFVWVEQIRGQSINLNVDVGSTADGGVVVPGGAGLDTTFGTGNDSVVLTAEGNHDMFVARYDASGDLVRDSQDELWVRQASAPPGSHARGYDFEVVADGSFQIMGGFGSAVSLGEGIVNVQLTGRGLSDVFLVRYTSDGAVRGHW